MTALVTTGLVTSGPVTTLLVIAKQPVPGRVKTRLVPPCTYQQAAVLAEAALADTLRAGIRSRSQKDEIAQSSKPAHWDTHSPLQSLA